MEVLIVEDDENYRFEIEQELAGYFEAYVNFHYANCLQDSSRNHRKFKVFNPINVD